MISFNEKIVEFRQNSANAYNALTISTVAEPPPPPAANSFLFSTDAKPGYLDEVYLYYGKPTADEIWSIVDVDTGETVADSSGVAMDGVENIQRGDPTRGNINILRDNGGIKKYEVFGTFDFFGVDYYDSSDDGAQEGEVFIDITIHHFSTNIAQYYFWCEQTNLKVPNQLPQHVTQCDDMFAGCNLFNQDISMWNTINVTNMYDMFYQCRRFNQPIGKWNVRNVTDMDWMFERCDDFNQPLNDWNVTSVNNMSGMFSDALSFNQPLNKWSVDNVTDMDSMFEYAVAFNQDLSMWCVTNIPSLPDDFDYGADVWVKPRPNWGTCSLPLDPDPVDPTDPTDPPGPVVPEPEPEDVTDSSELQDFDYALLRYRWPQEGGRDLDTRTYMQVPNRVDRMVGWAMRSSDERYLIWNNDNTGQGVESILLDVKQLATDFPDEPIISVALRAFWYSTKRTGNLSIEFATYKGGSMVASGYDWANVGGTPVQLLSISTHTPIQRSSAKERGQHLATLNFDPTTNTGELVKITEFTGYAQGGNLGVGPSIDGEGSSIGPVSGSTAPGDTSGGIDGDYGDYDETTGGTGVIPPIPSASEGAEFKVTIPDYAPETKLVVSVYGIVGEWALFESGTVIAGTNYYVNGVTKNTYENSVVINIAPQKDVIKSYKLVANAQSVTIQFGDYSTHARDCDFELFTYLPTATGWRISAREATLKVPRDLPSHFTSMDSMFAGSANFNQDISHWNTANITSLSDTFSGCTKFNQDISRWNTSSVTEMNGTFRETKQFNQDIGGWDVSNVTAMSSMFYYAAAFNQDLDRWNTASLVNITSMFDSTELFNGKIGTWNVSKVDSLNSVFRDSKSFNQDLDGWDTSSVTMMYETFKNAVAFNGNISTWNTSNVTNMYRTFYETGAFDSDIGGWDVSRVTDMSYMFEGAVKFNKNIGGWNTVSVTDMDRMFNKAGRFNQDLSRWCVPNLSSPYDFSYNAYRWGLPKPVWGTCPRGENGGDVSPESNIPAGLDFTVRSANGYNNELTVWLTDVTGDWAMYSGSVLVYSQAKLGSSVTVDAAAKKVKIRIPTGTYAKTYRLVGNFKGIEMSMSRSSDNRTSTEFTLHKFSPTVSSYKFALEGTDIEIQDSLPAVVTTIRDMFKGSDLFNSDISMWNVTNVTNMRGVFDGCSYFNANLSAWDVSNVTDMVNMFAGCFKFNQNLSTWNVTNIQRKPIGFSPNNSQWILPKPIWGTNAGIGDVPPVVQGGETDTCVIKITNTDTLLTEPLEVVTQIYQPGSVWSVKDLDTDVVVASNTNPTSTDPRIICSKNSTFLTVKSLSPVADTKRYAITASGTSASIKCRPTIGSDITAHGVLELESFSNQIGAYTFTVTNVDLIVPNYLPTNIKTLKQMFYYAGAFNQDLSTWNTANVTDMDSVFLQCKYFDGDISTWDTSNVTTMSNMFKGCVRFNSDLSNWNVSKVTKFNLMFNDCTRFSSDLSEWRPVAGTDFNNMFRECVNFNSDLSEWTVDSGINFVAMFYNCKKFNQDLSNWNTGNATDMDYMFEYADMLGQDLSTWCVGKIRNTPSGFMRYTVENRYNSPVWGTCPIKGMGFMLQSDDSVQSDVPFTLSATNVASNWTLKCNDVLIASATYTAPDVSVEGDVDIKITLSNLRNKSLDYVLRANSDCVTLGDPTYESYVGTRIVTVKSFLNQIRSYKFRVGDDLLTVPDKLPLTIATLSGMFEGCINFNQNINGWNTSAIADMSGMFKGCTTFNRSLSTWDVRQVTDMSGMFWGCTTFNQDISVWKPERVTNMQNMFRDCYSYNRPMSTWNVSTVTNFSYMFYGCRMFNQDISTWSTVYVTDMSYMFYGCVAYNKPIDDWNVASTLTMSHMFDGCTLFNQSINLWDVERVLDFDYMFNNCVNYNQKLDLWCVARVITTPTGFNTNTPAWITSKPVWGTCPLTGLIISTRTGNTSQELDIVMRLPWDRTVWSLVDLETNQVLVNETGSLVNDDNVGIDSGGYLYIRRRGRSSSRYHLKGKLSSVIVEARASIGPEVDFATIEQFSYHIKQHQFQFGNATGVVPNTLPAHVTTLVNMFTRSYLFNQDLSGWDTSNVTNMSGVFSYSNYNQPLNSWDTSNVTNMSSMFRQNGKFNQSLNAWDTSNVTDMNLMFYEAREFNGDVSTWDVGRVTDMSNMFAECNVFNQDISDWDVGSVRTMYSALNSCTAFNQDIGKWNVSNVTNMDWMMYDCAVFNQDLSQWCVTFLDSAPTSFDSTTPAWTLPKPVWGTCPRLELQPPKPTIPQPTEQPVLQVPEAIESTVYKFSTTNVLNPEMRLPITITWGDSYRPFILKENGIEIANYNTGEYGEGVTKDSYQLYIRSKVGGVSNYELTATNTSVQLRYGKIGIDEFAVEGEVTVEAFSSTVSNFQYDLPCVKLTVPDQIPATITSMNDMFDGCTLFNQNINAWDVSRVTSMSDTFSRCKSYNQPVSNWNTSNVINMYRMFSSCSVFNQHLNNWDVSNVVNMSYMFDQASVFDAKLDKWNTGKVIQMTGMFQRATFFNQDISMWDTSNVSALSSMFLSAYYFNQDLSGWCVGKIENSYYYSGFDSRAIAWTLPKPVWGTCPTKPMYFPIDITGASGTYLTISKNNGPYVTFNLADPDMDKAAFTNMIVLGQNNASAAFFDFPGITLESGTDFSKVTGLCGIQLDGKVVTPDHPGGFEVTSGFALSENIVVVPPYNITPERNKLSIKATPGVDKSLDIYYSIPGVTEHGSVSTYSAAVINFAP